MTEAELQRANKITCEIKENNRILDFFSRKDNDNKKSIELLCRFFNNARNISNTSTKNKLAEYSIYAIIKKITDENTKLEKEIEEI